MNFLKLEKIKKDKLENYHKIIKNIIIIISLFCVIVSFILIWDVIRFKKSDPINSKYLKNLIEQVHNDYNNKELKELIREYDLIIRKAHFYSLEFHKIGSNLLISGLIVLIIAFKFLFELKRKLPFINRDSDFNKLEHFKNYFKYFLLGISFFIILFSVIYNELNKNKPVKEKLKVKQEKKIITKYESLKQMKLNWTSFRGYNGLGISNYNDEKYNNDKTIELNLLWKKEILNPGFNSPIIWKNQIFLSGANESKREVYCFSLHKGELLWSRATSYTQGVTIPEVIEDTGLSAPTMTLNGVFVSSIFATGEIITLDLKGNIIWEKKLVIPKNHYGHSSSLIAYKGKLFVQYDHSKDAKLLCFDISNGNILYEIKRDVETSWTSPIIVNVYNQDQLILLSVPFIIAYNIENGDELWRIKDLISGEPGPSPAFYDDILFVTNQYDKLAAYDIISKKVLWKIEDDLPDASSPLVFKNFLVLPTSFGKISLINAKTGKVLKQEKFKPGFYSSPILHQFKVYLIDKKGILRVFKLDDKFNVIYELDIKEECFATPAFLEDKIIIRGFKNLFCYEIKDE